MRSTVVTLSIGLALLLLGSPTGLGAEGPRSGDSPSAATVRVELDLPAATPDLQAPASGRVHLTLRTRGQEDPISWVRPVDLPGDTVFELPLSPSAASTHLSSTARVEVVAPGFWAPAETVLLSEQETRVHISLRPTGRVKARIAVEGERPGEPPPDTVTLRFRSAPEESEWEGAPSSEGTQPLRALESEHTVECPVEEGRLNCELPAGSLDLRFRARGFVSLFRWDIEVPPHGVADAGLLRFQPGASVIGWVQGADEAFRPEQVTVELAPRSAAPSREREVLERGDRLVETTRANDRGFYQLAGVAAGSYVVVLRHPGLAPTRIEPVLVRQGLELELPTVELQPPLEVTFAIRPRRDPWGQPWSLTLRRQGTMVGAWPEVAQGSPDGEGLFRAAGLEPGLHRLVVTDSRGSRWHDGKVEIVEPDGFHQVTLPFERLEGLVTLAGEPLAATVYFGGRSATEQIVTRAKEEGKFYVFLPVRDRWLVEVENRSLNLLARIEGVEVEKESGEPWARVEIEVPDTRLDGEVVDELGRPLEGARVEVYGPGSNTGRGVRTDEDGRFEIRGFEPGTWAVEARHRAPARPGEGAGVTRYAPLRDVSVVAEEVAGPVRLVATAGQRLNGQVVSPEGRGIPGTMIVPLLEQGLFPVSRRIEHRTTDLSGVFDLWVPEGAEGVQLQVFPPGYAARQLRIPLPPPEVLMIPVDPAVGTLVVVPEEPEALEGWELHTRTAIFGEYLFVTPALRLWAGNHGVRSPPERLVVPGMEPGLYTACYGVVQEALPAGRLPAGLEDRCDSGTLAPGGDLVLRVPVEARQEPR